ncbi:MAG: hypothetical protein ABIO29_02845 [Sphingomicrobium sp.]
MNRASPPPVEVERISTHAHWWERRSTVIALALVAMVPLIYPQIPPLVDLFGHMGRYRVELDLATSTDLQRYWGFHWAAIGNLGADLLMMVLGPLLGLEPATKLIVLLIPPLTVAGFLFVAREVHGEVPPTAYFAVPFVFGHPFMFGFVNYVLSIALAFLAFGLWLRLGRQGRTWLRAALFVPISIVVFFTHTYGWGVLGLLCVSAEAVRQHDRGRGWFMAGVHAAIRASVMALPIVITLIWRTESGGGESFGWFELPSKWTWVQLTLRDRWFWFDLAGVFIAMAVLIAAALSKGLTFSRNLAFTALVLLASFIVIPRTVFGSAYADMRIIPYVFATALLAIRFKGQPPKAFGQALAIAAIAFCALRLGGNTLSLGIAANDQTAKLAALNHVEMGARVLSLDGLACGRVWSLPRNSHLGAMTIVRRNGFSNDQWITAGLNLMDLKYGSAGFFSVDPSQIVRPEQCPDRIHLTIDQTLRNFPRSEFDYVWLIDPPAYDPALVADLQPIWRGPGSILYRVQS